MRASTAPRTNPLVPRAMAPAAPPPPLCVTEDGTGRIPYILLPPTPHGCVLRPRPGVTQYLPLRGTVQGSAGSVPRDHWRRIPVQLVPLRGTGDPNYGAGYAGRGVPVPGVLPGEGKVGTVDPRVKVSRCRGQEVTSVRAVEHRDPENVGPDSSQQSTDVRNVLVEEDPGYRFTGYRRQDRLRLHGQLGDGVQEEGVVPLGQPVAGEAGGAGGEVGPTFFERVN